MLLLELIVALCLLSQGLGRASQAFSTYAYEAWSRSIKSGTCSTNSTPLNIALPAKTGSMLGVISCSLKGQVKAYRFPAGIFEIHEQMLVPENTSIAGAKSPNDMSSPTIAPDWREQTLFLATRGVTDYDMKYCHAANMVNTRVGFVLSSFVTVRDVSYQGIDTIRPQDNGALCGGGVFETKGCAENDCRVSSVNNAGSDGIGSIHVIIENVRLNDYYYAEEKARVGASIQGNYQCKADAGQCCFCKPNGIRTSQVGIYVPETRNAEGTRHLFVNNVVSRSTQADGINLHGSVHDALVQNTYFENTGDDTYALWGASLNPGNVTFKSCVAVNPGILRPNWYGNCVATYGLQSVVFDRLTCKAPTLQHAIPQPGGTVARIDNSMFVFYTSFGGTYPAGNSVTIKGWTFEDLQGNAYAPENGTMNFPKPGKMVWSKSDGDKGATVAPYYLPDREQQVNVHVMQGLTQELVALAYV